MVAAVTIRKKPPPPLDRGWAWMIVLGVSIISFFMIGVGKSYGLFLLEFVRHFETSVTEASLPMSIGALVYAVGGVFIYVFFMVGTAKSYGLFMLEFLRYFGVSTAYAAMPMSVSAFVYALGAPTAILLAELITPQKVVIIGAIIGLIGMALSSLLLNMAYVTVFFGVCFGIGNSCFYGNGLVMLGKYFRKRRSFATGLGLAGASIGQFVMPPIIEFLLETYGLGGTLLIMGALYLHCAVSGALFRPIEQYGPEEKPAEVIEVEDNSEPGEEREVLVKTDPGYSNFEEELSVPDDYKTPLNGDVLHSATNGTVTDKDGNTYVSFGDVTCKDTSDLIEGEDDSYVDAAMKRRSKRWSEILEEEEKKFVERKALLASTGSIFLVSPSILDVSDIDTMAHGVDTTTPKKRPTGLRRIFDFSVLRSYITVFFIAVSFLCFFGYFNFILFLPPILVERGITKYEKAMLISVCGAGDLIARIGTGFFADLNLIARYKLKALACLLSGINIFVVVFADSVPWLGVHSFIYGFLGGAYVCLMSVVLVDFVGVELMAKNLAIILLIQGMGAALGQIFLGWVSDEAGSFDIVIIICSLHMIFGALLLFCYPVVRRWEDARLARVEAAKQTTS